MTRDETKVVFAILRTAFPAFYSKCTAEDLRLAIDLWEEMFAADDVNIVKYALHKIISTAKFPPTIGEVKETMRGLMQAATNEATDEELWQMLKSALRDGIWGAEDAFDKLPPILKRYCGTPSTIRDLAVIDTDTLDTVYHGQFLKQISTIRNREESLRDMPEGIKGMMQQVYMPLAESPALTEAEWNDRRNAILDQLEGGA